MAIAMLASTSAIAQTTTKEKGQTKTECCMGDKKTYKGECKDKKGCKDDKKECKGKAKTCTQKPTSDKK